MEPDRSINKNTKFAYKNVGYGLASFEAGDDFERYEGDKLHTSTFDSIGMHWHDTRGWTFDGGLGLVTYLVKKENMTQRQIEEAWGEGEK